MAYGDLSYRARTNPHAPQAHAVCDECGGHYNLVDLKSQTEYYGDTIQDTGYLVCQRCLSQPQPQLSTPILPEDPQPVLNPRPEFYSVPTDAATVKPVFLVDDQGNVITDDDGNPITAGWNSSPGAVIAANLNNGFGQFTGPQGLTIRAPLPTELDPSNPLQSKADVLASAQTGWGQPIPFPLTDHSGTIAQSGVGQQIMPANPARQYLLIFSPFTGLLAVAQNASPVLRIRASYWDNPYTAAPMPPTAGTVIVGAGQGLLQNALSSPAGTVWSGSVWALGLMPGQRFFAWDA